MPVLRGLATDWYSRLHPSYGAFGIGVEVWKSITGMEERK
jgi:hypothetical protein